jgi:hypothetical protein
MEEMEERVVVDAVASKIDATCVFFTHKSSYTRRGQPYLNAVDVAQTISSGGNTSRRIIDRVKLTGCHGTHPRFRLHITEDTEGSTTPSASVLTSTRPNENTPLLDTSPPQSGWPAVVNKLSDLVCSNQAYSILFIVVLTVFIGVVAAAEYFKNRKGSL